MEIASHLRKNVLLLTKENYDSLVPARPWGSEAGVPKVDTESYRIDFLRRRYGAFAAQLLALPGYAFPAPIPQPQNGGAGAAQAPNGGAGMDVDA